MKKFLILTLFLLGIGFSSQYSAQTGGRKREHRNQRHKGFRGGQASAGHADKFAKGTGRKGLFSRLFKKDKPSWTNHRSGSRRSHYRDNRNLFGRFRSKGKQYDSQTQDQQNAQRAKRRVRGSKVFSHKKY